MTAPDYTGWVETYLGMVDARECDAMGHFNVVYYMDRINQAAWVLGSFFGIDEGSVESNGVGFVALEHRIRYLKEFRRGEILQVKSTIREVGNKSMKFTHHLLHFHSGELGCELEATACCFDLKARKAIPWPDDMRAKLNRLIVNP